MNNRAKTVLGTKEEDKFKRGCRSVQRGDTEQDRQRNTRQPRGSDVSYINTLSLLGRTIDTYQN